MDVKEAVRTAKNYVAELFADEGTEYIGLEEVTFDDAENVWKVTISFYRAWDRQCLSALAKGEFPDWKKRSFKVVHIDDHTGNIVSMTHRLLAVPN